MDAFLTGVYVKTMNGNDLRTQFDAQFEMNNESDPGNIGECTLTCDLCCE